MEEQLARAQATGSMGAGLEPKRVATAGECAHSCLCTPMYPGLWRTLPKELLQLVFARVPVPKINQLRCLSREWRLSLYTGSNFMWACAEAGPKIFETITEHCQGLISVWLYDIRANRWHTFMRQFMEKHSFDTMCAGNLGLMCFVLMR